MWPGPAAQQAGPASWPTPVVPFLAPGGQGHAPVRAATRPAGATSPRHLLLLPLVVWMPRATPRAAPTALTLPIFSPSPFPHRARMPPSPPHALAVATASPSPLRHAQELRLVALKLSAEPHKPERPVEPSPSPSSPPAAADCHRRFVVSSASPATMSSPASPP